MTPEPAPTPPPGAALPRCAHCGYDLSGVGLGESIATCPECGASFDPERPLPIRPWPPLWRSALLMCGPVLLAIALDGIFWIASVSAGGYWGSVASEILRWFIPASWFAGPIAGAAALSVHHSHPAERWMNGLGLAVAGLLGATIVYAGWFLFCMVVGRFA